MPLAYKADQSANGSTVVLAAGQALLIELPENPTTGYRWVMQPCSGMRLDENTFSPGGGGIGAGGIRRLKLSATATGAHRLTLLQCREWEPASKFIARFDLTVVSS
jgi:inhibitor of cysteine peptidase